MNIALFRKNVKYLMSKRDWGYGEVVSECNRVCSYRCLSADIQAFIEKGSGNATTKRLQSLSTIFGVPVSKMLETDIEREDRFAF